MLDIRNARLDDAERLVEIYDYYVKNTAITFEYETPSVEEFKTRMANTMRRYPYLVIESDGIVMGYAYAGAFVGRSAYDWACEMTIYLAHDAQKQGLGRKLYTEMESILKQMGILNLYACIGYPKAADEFLTKNSAEFHTHMGYRVVGEFHNCGYKFGHWYDMIWMEKIVGKHTPNQPPVTAYSAIK